MPNWASVRYAVTGPDEVLDKIETACELEIDRWIYYIVQDINPKYTEEYIRDHKLHIRGYVIDTERSKETLCITTEEAWGLSDFADILQANFPDIEIYWIVEEPGCGIYVTNDDGGRYFPERYRLEWSEDEGDSFDVEYFTTYDDLWKFLREKLNIQNKNELQDNDYVWVSKFEVE